MSNKQQTAMEGLEKAFYSYAESTGINNNKWLIDEEDLDKLFQQAKAMEIEQIVECWNIAHQAGRFEGKGIAEENWQTFEQYYNETYNNESNNL